MVAPFRRALKALGILLLFVAILAMLAVTLVPPFLDFRYYAGPKSDHYDGERFFDPYDRAGFRPPTSRERRAFIPGLVAGGKDMPEWPDRVPVIPSRPPSHAAPGKMLVTWVGHATVLVQVDGLNILTDPVWSDVVGPLPPIGPRRLAAPGIRFDDLPRIDLVVLSHNHYDHFDMPTLKRLWQRDRPMIVVPLGNDSLLRAEGIPSRAIDWNQSVEGPRGVGRVTALRAHHWDSRWGVDRNRALWAAYLIRTRAGSIYFAGDVGPGDMRWALDARRYGPVRLAILPIGAFRFIPGQMVNANHIGPAEAVQIFDQVGAGAALPIHWGTFRLSMEGYATPPRMLDLFTACAGLPREAFRARAPGALWDVPALAPPRGDKPRIDPASCREGSPALSALK